MAVQRQNSATPPRPGARAGIAVAIALAAFGCAGHHAAEPSPEPLLPKGGALNSTAGQKELGEARRMIEEGNYTVVVPRLLHVITGFPNSRAAVDARYYLGLAYRDIKSYRDAIDMFNDYLRLAPDGKYAEPSKKYVSTLTEEYSRKFWTAEKLDARISVLTGLLKQQPDNLDAQWELADLLWKRGDYDAATRLYVDMIGKHPERANDPIVTGRIERQPSGQYLALTPTEILRREIQRQPIAIVNTSRFRSGKDLLTREAMYFVVTGQAVNRSDSVLYGVQVIVTIYGFGNVVYDTNTVNIGRLNPGETRAFSVRFSNFDDIENVFRYEAVGTFER